MYCLDHVWTVWTMFELFGPSSNRLDYVWTSWTMFEPFGPCLQTLPVVFLAHLFINSNKTNLWAGGHFYSRQPIECRVYLADGHPMLVEFDSASTADEVCCRMKSTCWSDFECRLLFIMARSHVIQFGLSTIHMQCREPRYSVLIIWFPIEYAPSFIRLLFPMEVGNLLSAQKLNYNAIRMENYLEIRRATMKTYR